MPPSLSGTAPPAGLVGVFGSSRTRPGTPAWSEAFALGRGLAGAGYGVATGGYGGSMEAVSAGAASAGRGVAIVGVTAPPLFPQRTGVNRFVTEEWPTRSLTARIGLLLTRSDALVALPGSIGTFTEVMVAWNQAYLELANDRAAKPLIVVGAAWNELVARVAAATGTDRAPVRAAAEVREALAMLLGTAADGA